MPKKTTTVLIITSQKSRGTYPLAPGDNKPLRNQEEEEATPKNWKTLTRPSTFGVRKAKKNTNTNYYRPSVPLVGICGRAFASVCASWKWLPAPAASNLVMTSHVTIATHTQSRQWVVPKKKTRSNCCQHRRNLSRSRLPSRLTVTKLDDTKCGTETRFGRELRPFAENTFLRLKKKVTFALLDWMASRIGIDDRRGRHADWFDRCLVVMVIVLWSLFWFGNGMKCEVELLQFIMVYDFVLQPIMF